MHRFRKKSDAKRTQVPDFLRTQTTEGHGLLLGLPPASDFRTSLILPDLSRRFSLLRTQSGDPVSLDDLRSRFAEQRARGAENQISEEEEDMILETLGRIRAKNATPSEKSDENTETDYSPSVGRQSVQSTNTASYSFSPSVTSSPSGRSTKRYSNNLFGSGRFRDYTYMRSVSSNRNGGSRSASSIAPTEFSLNLTESTSQLDSLRPVTPDGSVPSLSLQSSPDEKISVRSAPLIPPAPYGEQSLSAAEYRLGKTIGSSVFKRASLALEEAIKEIEEEVEDEIVMPRSTPVLPSAVVNQQDLADTRESESGPPSPFEAGMAISSDKQVRAEPEDRRVSPVPSRILPGYIPGMPRPMTPRDSLDSDDQRSLSTTPRATSPILPGFREYSPSPIIPPSLASGFLRRESNSSPSQQSPRPLSPAISPLFLQRSPSGRYTPDDTHRGADNSTSEFESSVNAFGRRRPASPLSGPAFQPMAVSSRPGTPSNVTWTTPQANSQKPSEHSRNGSWIGDVGVGGFDMTVSPDHSGRSARSPVLLDSPVVDRGHDMNSYSLSHSNGLFLSENQPSSPIPSIDLGSSILATNRLLRSPTPTQSAPCSPTSLAFSNPESASRNGSRRSSKQNAPSSPFSHSLFYPLVFSPIANSSRSSLESAGSSYHSWDGEQHKDRVLSLFSDIETQQPAWHDISCTDKSSSVTPGGSQDDGWDAEATIGRYAGLAKSDFLAIQEKLVSVAVAKIVTPDVGNRAPSLRRRRPSTSQSNYSFSGRDIRIASPPPQTQPPASPNSAPSNSDQYKALLNSVVDSLQYSKGQPSPLADSGGDASMSQTEKYVSPTARRNRDLAQVLFGLQGADGKESASPLSPSVPSKAATVISEETPGVVSSSVPNPATTIVPTDEPLPLLSPSSPNPLLRKSRAPQIPQSPAQDAQLARDVRRKTDAAMLALNKDPSNTNLTEGLGASGSISRKRVTPHQISTPRLVSASTSVDTIPLRSPSAASGQHPAPSKISSRFRMFRGSLRKAPGSTSEEVTPYSMDSPPPVQTAHYDPAKLSVPGGPGATSATELSRFKVPVPSPPASAGPGLKGFMARFRGKQRTADITFESDRQKSPQPSAPSFVTPSQQPERSTIQQQPSNSNNSDVTPGASIPHSPPSFASSSVPGTLQGDSGTNDESRVLKQFFDAASNLGLDPGALNDLLARSGSMSSRLMVNNPTTTSVRPATEDGNSADAANPAKPSNGRPLADSEVRNENFARKPSVRKQVDHVRRPRDDRGDNATVNAIVRRTVIFPSESRSSTVDLNVLMRKTSSRRRRISAASISSRSVHDRAPTPPPPRSPTTRRFSTDASPPVPQLPSSFSGQAESLLSVPQPVNAGGPIEKSSSTYDSLYEMYAGESKAGSLPANDIHGPDGSQNSQSEALANPEPRPALEVIELANGETIWSIVNGLRDDDAESVYTSRTSFASEHSTRESNDDSVQVLVKELGRTNSRTGNSSLVPRKKPQQGNSRPETKVFYSSSAQIGRLIESLSQGMESGSFNFLPNNRPGHSASSSLTESDINWTVEERLEHMLGSMGPN